MAPGLLVRLSVVLVGSSLVPLIASAQDPWIVTVVAASPVPIGSCAAVRLQVRNAKTGEVPRAPNGDRVSMADFDMTVTGNAVAPQYQDAYHLLACACQGASVGSSATITAVYPASVLPPNMRVAGVSAKGSGTFSVGRPDNKLNPVACTTASVAPRLAAMTAAVKTGGGTTTAPTSPLTAAPISSPVRAPAPASGPAPATGTTSTPGSTTSTPAPTPLLLPSTPIPGAAALPLSSTPTSSSTATKVGVPAPPPPTTPVPVNPVGFSAVQIAPGVVRLSWQEVIAATYYVLFGPGLPEGGVKVFGVNGVGGNTPEIMIAAYTATGVPSGLQEWKVASYYEPGPVSTPASEFTRTLLNVIPPAAVNPTGFTAVQISSARVKLSWQPVAGAAYYVVRGPGLPDSSATVQANLAAGVSSAGTATSSGTVELTANGVASGLRRWTLASYFDPGAVSTPETEFPRVWLNVKPPINPSGFIARQIGPGKVQFIWEAVSGASYYVLTGTGIPPGGARVSGGSAGASGSSVSNSAPLSEDSNAFNTSAPPVSTAASVAMVDFTATGIRAGRGDWFVGSYFDPGGISSEASQFTKVALDVIGPPNPTDLTAVQVAPGQVTIRWKLVSGAAYYWLVGTGLPTGGTKVLLDGLGFATSATAPDAFMTYTVTAVRSGLSAWRVGSYFEPGALSTPVTEYTAVTLNVLPPPNPSGFAAVQTGSGQVRLSFAPVSGAAYYVISGSGLPADGVRIDQVAGASNSTGSVNTIGFTVNGLPPSLASWQVGSYFEPGPVASNAAAFSKVSLTIVSPFQ